MALNSGLSSISFAGTTVASVGSVSISLNRPSLDITPIGSAVNTFIAGVQGATATLDIFYDQAANQHTALENAINGATAAAQVVLTLDTNQTYTGNAFVTSFEITAQAGSVVRASVGLQFTGAITIA
jgi:predicted secreted protein